jgi:5-methylcytosine-specific restriction enzyme subunit McrC
MDPGLTLSTYRLTERTATECRLTPDDVDFLLAAHRAHVKLIPTRRRDVYRLTPGGHVGTIVAPGCRLLIRPKIPVRNLFYLLDPTGPAPAAEDRTAAAPGADLLDLLAVHLARLLAERAARGLHRAYVERSVHGPFLQGRLDLPAQLRGGHGRKDRVHSRHEDFTADVPCNQVPRATAEFVLRSPLLGEAARRALRQSLIPFTEVSPVSLGPESFASAVADRLAEAYRPLLELCRLLAESLSPGEAAGASTCPAFLLDLERVFERYLTGHCVAAWDDMNNLATSIQPLLRPHSPVAGQSDLSMRPDLILECDGRPELVVDAKWKRLPQGALLTADVYQVLAYCAALGIRRAALVYPGRRSRRWEYRFERSPVRLEVHALRVVGSREKCLAAARRLTRQMARAKSGPQGA